MDLKLLDLTVYIVVEFNDLLRLKISKSTSTKLNQKENEMDF